MISTSLGLKMHIKQSDQLMCFALKKGKSQQKQYGNEMKKP